MEKIRLPVGFRFNPTDEEEVVKDYLLRKIKGEELPWNDIKYFDIYGDKSPWEIFQKNNITDENKILYVFTELKRASRNRISRVAGCGTWHGDKRTIEIYDGEEEDDVIIGLRKTLSFKYNNRFGSKRGQWIMHEFSLAGKYIMGKQGCDYVLCRIEKIGKSCLELAEAEAVSAAALQTGLEVESCTGDSIGNTVCTSMIVSMEKENHQRELMADQESYSNAWNFADNYFDNPVNRFEASNTELNIASSNFNFGTEYYLQAAGYVDQPQFDAEVDCFAAKNEVDMLLDQLDTLLQSINTEGWGLSMLEKYLMDDDEQQPVDEETSKSVSVLQEEEAAADRSYTGDWIPPSNMAEENSKYDANYMQQYNNINGNNEVVMLEFGPISPEENWRRFLSDEYLINDIVNDQQSFREDHKIPVIESESVLPLCEYNTEDWSLLDVPEESLIDYHQQEISEVPMLEFEKYLMQDDEKQQVLESDNED